MLTGHRGWSTLRRTLALFMAGLLGVVATLEPVSADAAPSAGGSCGPAPGVYGRQGVGAEEFGAPGNTVPALYYRIDYNVLAPTQIGVILRRDDDLGTGGVLTVFNTGGGTGGSFESAWRADIRPENQGYHNSVGPSTGRFDGPATSQRLRGGPAQSYYLSGGLTPGGWHFYIYTGVVRYDEGIGYRFIVDEAGYLGKFVCNVADNDAKN